VPSPRTLVTVAVAFFLAALVAWLLVIYPAYWD
jgi:hypothetical protein